MLDYGLRTFCQAFGLVNIESEGDIPMEMIEKTVNAEGWLLGTEEACGDLADMQLDMAFPFVAPEEATPEELKKAIDDYAVARATRKKAMMETMKKTKKSVIQVPKPATLAEAAPLLPNKDDTILKKIQSLVATNAQDKERKALEKAIDDEFKLTRDAIKAMIAKHAKA